MLVGIRVLVVVEHLLLEEHKPQLLSQVVVVEEDPAHRMNILIQMRAVAHQEIKVEMVQEALMVMEETMGMVDLPASIVLEAVADYWEREAAQSQQAVEHHLLVAVSVVTMMVVVLEDKVGSAVVVVRMETPAVEAVVVILVVEEGVTPHGPLAVVAVPSV